MANVRCQIVKAFNQYQAGEVKSLDQAVAEKWEGLGLLEIMEPQAPEAPPRDKAPKGPKVGKGVPPQAPAPGEGDQAPAPEAGQAPAEGEA